MQDTLLSLQHISKDFGEGDVLRDISLDVARGEFVTLLGASGCGKTTTLRIISGLETPVDGDGAAGRPGRHRAAAGAPSCQHGLSELRALSAYERRKERGLRPARAQDG